MAGKTHKVHPQWWSRLLLQGARILISGLGNHRPPLPALIYIKKHSYSIYGYTAEDHLAESDLAEPGTESKKGKEAGGLQARQEPSRSGCQHTGVEEKSACIRWPLGSVG